MVAMGIVIGIIGWWMRPRKWAKGLVAIAPILIQPILGVILLAVAFGTHHVRSIARQRRLARTRSADTLLAFDLIALATTAGLGFLSSARSAADAIGGSTGSTIERSSRRVQAGLDHGLGEHLLARAFDAAARSAATGSPLADGLVGLAIEVRLDEASRESERLERLPVKLLFPLAFLILPGFILVAVVPSILSGLSQLTL